MGTSADSGRTPASPVPSEQAGNWLDVIKRQVSSLKFGSVQITVHEGRVVQIETSVKVRFDKPQ